MKKVNCTVLFKETKSGYEIKRIIIKTKLNNIGVLLDDKITFKRFGDAYNAILSTLKANNFYVKKWQIFNATFYDIDFINLDSLEVNRYPLTRTAKSA